jgi:Tol biopolymer transport system component
MPAISDDGVQYFAGTVEQEFCPMKSPKRFHPWIHATLAGAIGAAMAFAADPAPPAIPPQLNTPAPPKPAADQPIGDRERYQQWLGNLGIYANPSNIKFVGAPKNPNPIPGVGPDPTQTDPGPKPVTPIVKPKMAKPMPARPSEQGGLPKTNLTDLTTPAVDTTFNIWQASRTREGGDFSVDVHPDGKQIIYTSTQHSHAADLYVKSTSGYSIRQLTQDPANDVMPSISPDGKKVAFASDRSGNWDIYVMNFDGSNAVELITRNSPTHELHPSWSPNGKEIIFSSLGERSGQWEMVVVKYGNPAHRTIVGHGLFPRFNPNPKMDQIVYQQTRKRGSRRFSIWTLDRDTDKTGPRWVRPTEIAVSTNAALINPDWNPTGTRVVFASIVDPSTDPDAEPDSSDLWVINANGTGLRALTHDFYTNLQPAWGMDGTIFFVSNRSGWENIWAIRSGVTTGKVTDKSKMKFP